MPYRQQQQPIQIIPPPPRWAPCVCCGQPIMGLTQRSGRFDPWSEAQDEYVVRAHERGASSKLIAWSLGCKPSSVANRLMALRKFGR